jgi:predicted house-cleaning noncanonical NTP pyrophosphatase (MazG superfamily)
MKYTRSITEARAIELLNKLYGDNPILRVEKLEEEIEELSQAIINIEYGRESIDKVIDELSDCYIILTHIASLYGVHGAELLDIAIDKIKQRQTDPNYKRK